MATNKQYEYKRLKSTPGMWILYFVFLGILLSISIIGINKFISLASGDSLPTKVFTIDNGKYSDVVSLKIPDDWLQSSESDSNALTWISKDGYESLSISSVNEKSVAEASVMYMLEIRNMFPDVEANFEYNEINIGDKKMFATQILYESKYYLCGVRESGNTIIKFVYSASAMAGEISDIDTIIESINYRKGSAK